MSRPRTQRHSIRRKPYRGHSQRVEHHHAGLTFWPGIACRAWTRPCTSSKHPRHLKLQRVHCFDFYPIGIWLTSRLSHQRHCQNLERHPRACLYKEDEGHRLGTTKQPALSPTLAEVDSRETFGLAVSKQHALDGVLVIKEEADDDDDEELDLVDLPSLPDETQQPALISLDSNSPLFLGKPANNRSEPCLPGTDNPDKLDEATAETEGDREIASSDLHAIIKPLSELGIATAEQGETHVSDAIVSFSSTSLQYGSLNKQYVGSYRHCQWERYDVSDRRDRRMNMPVLTPWTDEADSITLVKPTV